MNKRINLFKLETYYFLKSFIPRRLQLVIRRELIRRKLPLVKDIWPIDEKASKEPEGWKGWPNGKKFALVLTHDVETKAGLEKCNALMEIEEKLGFRSSFGFVAGDYRVPQQLLKTIENRGFESYIHGLHHNKNLFRSKKAFNRQSSEINSYLKKWNAVGFRSPSMFHNLDLIHGLNVDYDASTFDTDPFEPQPDGMSTIFPFLVSDTAHQKGYVELPYTLPQDFLLFILMMENNIDIWKMKLDWVAKHSGMALIITHPDYMNFDGTGLKHYEYPVRFYQEMLQYVKEKYEDQYWHSLAKDMARFWVNNYSYETKHTIKKKHICMLVYSFYESDNRVMRYAETLTRRGDHVDVIALRKEDTAAYEQIRGVNVFRIQTRLVDEKGRLSYLMKLLKFFINSAIFVTKEHFKNPYDLIHVHSVPDFEVFATLVPKLKGAKIILDIHDLVPEFYASKFREQNSSILFKMLVAIEKSSINFSDHVIISNHIWEKRLLSRSVNSNRCSVILNYPDQTIFYKRAKNRSDDKFIMIYPGTFGWHQGLDIAIKAFATIKDQTPDVEFHIYGRGPEKKALLNLITKLSLQDKVFLNDPLPIEQIADIMGNSNLGIVPKRNDPFGGEAFSTKILEFMSLGIPVIVSATTIDKYYFNDSVVKFFKPDDVNDLAECMLTLINDKKLYNDLVEKESMFIEHFTWEKKKIDYLNLVDSLVRNDNLNITQSK
ncbi:MAG: glycosyltransferase [Syntrophaceae bacterium]